MYQHFVKSLLGSALLTFSMSTMAADIDLFVGQTPPGASSAPNVLLVMDNAANFSASVSTQHCSISPTGVVDTSGSGTYPTGLDGHAGAIEQCALYSVLKALDTSGGVKVNVGVMIFNSNGQSSYNALNNTFYSASCSSYGSSNGGCLAAPIVGLTATTKANLLDWISKWQVSGNGNYNIKGNNTANGATMQEAWAYLNGKVGLSGRDYSSIQPPTGNCGKNYVVFIGNDYRNNSAPKDATGDAGPMNALLGTNTTSGMNASPPATTTQKTPYGDTITTACGTATLSTSENSGAYALNWANYMYGQGTVTYSVGIIGPTCASGYASHLYKMGEASVGGGKYFPTNNYASLVAAFKTIFGEIQAVNSVFAAVSLPVSVNNQQTYINEIYVGMFRPDAQSFPRWMGNLKHYKVGSDSNGNTFTADADGTNAINTSTGFITDCARSFWTPNTVESPGYWNGDTIAKGNCGTTATDSTYSNYPDGSVVEKGGQAYKLRNTSTTATTTSRTVMTCDPNFATCSATSALTSFDTTNAAITQALLDPTNTVPVSTLINFARGLNVNDATEPVSKGPGVMRPSVHGDVVHSRPIAVNYGTDANPAIVVYYGGNDGVLRAINGNRDNPTNATVGNLVSAGTTYGAGTELWSFMPPEFYGNIKRLYDNTVTVSFQGTIDPNAQPKPYGFDGPITAFRGNIGGVSKTWIYATMRRGGRTVYAFDVTTPGAPTLKWKKGCPNAADDNNCSNDANGNFSGIGQSWSAAQTLYASGYGSGASPMIMIGGGYDNCEDIDNGTANNSCTSSNKGHVIYVMDAATGKLLKSFNTDRGVAGDINIISDATSGMAKYAYATDLGGNVYRISGVDANTAFASTDPSNWTMTKIASLGCDTVTTCSANRKFLYGPDVVADNGKYIILVGSGDREKPLSAYTAAYGTTNYFFRITDSPADSTWLSSEASNCSNVSIICLNSLLAITTSANPTQAAVDAKKGWYLGLAAHEQVVTSAVTTFGYVHFSTHIPAVPVNGSCGSNLGTANVYNIAYTNAAPSSDSRYAVVTGGGLSPSPVAGLVTLDNGQTIPFCISCFGTSTLATGKVTAPPNGSASQYKSRVYWYIQK